MKYSILIILFFAQTATKAQIDSTYLNSFLILAEDNFVRVEDGKQKVVFQKQFNNPYESFADIDYDQFDEMIVIDSIITNGRLNFIIYLYNAEEYFELIDSIYSGSFFPFVTYSDEIEAVIIETGASEFEIFNQLIEAQYLPINLWKVENSEVILVNDELYEPFVFENTNLIQLLDYYTSDKSKNCVTSKLYEGLIASVFANYLNAGEQSLANQMLKKYYLCDDVTSFKQEILDIIFPKAK